MSDRFDPRPSFDISGRVAVVTGATGGLGSVVVLGLAACGGRVVVTGRRAEATETLVACIRERGGEAVAVVGDIIDPAGRQRVIAAAIDSFGGIDILVNNAGVARRVGAAEVTVQDYGSVHGLMPKRLSSSVKLRFHT